MRDNERTKQMVMNRQYYFVTGKTESDKRITDFWYEVEKSYDNVAQEGNSIPHDPHQLLLQASWWNPHRRKWRIFSTAEPTDRPCPSSSSTT